MRILMKMALYWVCECHVSDHVSDCFRVRFRVAVCVCVCVCVCAHAHTHVCGRVRGRVCGCVRVRLSVCDLPWAPDWRVRCLERHTAA